MRKEERELKKYQKTIRSQPTCVPNRTLFAMTCTNRPIGGEWFIDFDLPARLQWNGSQRCDETCRQTERPAQRHKQHVDDRYAGVTRVQGLLQLAQPTSPIRDAAQTALASTVKWSVDDGAKQGDEPSSNAGEPRRVTILYEQQVNAHDM